MRTARPPSPKLWRTCPPQCSGARNLFRSGWERTEVRAPVGSGCAGIFLRSGELLQFVNFQNAGGRIEVCFVLLAAQFQCLVQSLEYASGGQIDPNVFPILVRKP